MLLTSTTVGGCPLCGANHATCGPPSTATPVDILAAKESTVATQKYRVTVNNHQTTLKLSAEDAKAYPGAELVDESSDRSEAPAKSRRAPNKARGPQADK